MEISQRDIEELKKLELSLAQAGKPKNPDSFHTLLANEFIEFGTSGKIHDKQQAVAAINKSKTMDISFTEFNVRSLAQNLALVTYHSHKHQTGSNDIHALRSSIWRRTRNGWRLIFHQGTPTAAK